MIIPTLATERLTLRPLLITDFPAYEALMASQRAVYMGGPYNTFGAWGLFCHETALWHLFGHGGLTIDLSATGESIGQVGINHGPLFPDKELGWQLYAGYEGHGYATEAAIAMRDWAFDERGLPTLVSYFDPANSRSIAIAERMGARRDDTAPQQDADDVVYRHSPKPSRQDLNLS